MLYVSHREDEESMGTLLAKGHTVYPKESSEFENDYYVGSTYKVPVQEFECIVKIDNRRNIEKIKTFQQKVDTEKFRKSAKLYLRIDR